MRRRERGILGNSEGVRTIIIRKISQEKMQRIVVELSFLG